jgi:hypothetical protein
MLAAPQEIWDFRRMRSVIVPALILIALSASAAEKHFNFSDCEPGKMPPGFRSMVAGEGKPGDWQVVMDEVPPLLPPLTPQAPSTARRAVLGQLSKDATDERFPILVYDDETFGDFTMTTRFKTVDGQKERMAGLAFRIQDEKNFYVLRASVLGRNIRFYKVVGGVRSLPIGPDVEISNGVWHELSVTCKGNEIRCLYDGREIIPPLTDATFNTGKVGFWTKSDSVSYFVDAGITYTPRVPPAQVLIQKIMEKYPRILALKVYALDESKQQAKVIASKNKEEIGEAGGQYEVATIEKGTIQYAKTKSHIAVVMPLRDRNGDVVAAVRVHLSTFPGQTEENAIARATPIVKEMQEGMQAYEKLED